MLGDCHREHCLRCQTGYPAAPNSIAQTWHWKLGCRLLPPLSLQGLGRHGNPVDPQGTIPTCGQWCRCQGSTAGRGPAWTNVIRVSFEIQTTLGLTCLLNCRVGHVSGVASYFFSSKLMLESNSHPRRPQSGRQAVPSSCSGPCTS